jgi:uncharacterized SAM-binding protein YcdF (DUF218 family)
VTMRTSAVVKRRLKLILVLAAALLVFAALAGNILVVDAPQPADWIVVLAGETDRRPALGLKLMRDGYAHKMVIDVPERTRIYNATLLQLTANYVQGLPEAAQVTICPIEGLSTRDESHDLAKCIEHEGASRILLVTSDYHTRRALSIFRHELKGRSFSVAAAHDDAEFGVRWWTHRQWAKTCFYEWLRFLWWGAVERWH